MSLLGSDELEDVMSGVASGGGGAGLLADVNSTIGKSLPRQLDPDHYALILASTDPIRQFGLRGHSNTSTAGVTASPGSPTAGHRFTGVPIRSTFLLHSHVEPGMIYMIDRPSWHGAINRSAQKRQRDGEDQMPGGWNRRGLPKVGGSPPFSRPCRVVDENPRTSHV